MFKINRNSGGKISTGLNSSLRTNKSVLSRNSLNKNILNKSFKDNSRLTTKINIEKINSYKRLTKLNIKELLFQKIKRTNIENPTLNNSQQNNTNIYNNSILPKVPDYKPNNQNIKSDQNNIPNFNIPEYKSITLQNINNQDINNQDIEKLPKKTIETQLDMAKLFNEIMNGNNIPTINDNGEIEYKLLNIIKQNIDNTEYDFLNINVIQIVLSLQNNVLNLKNINYPKYIEIIINLKKQYPKNNMIKSIIYRAISKYNRQQFYKIPEDKLNDVIDIVLNMLSTNKI